ncbi:MAG: TIR domain-containing protein [Candidatus Thiodiazotropha taylori]
MPIPLAYIAAAGLFTLGGYLLINGKRKKVFVSYYSKGDSHFKNLIIAWANNNKFDLQLDDISTDVNIRSNDVSYLKRRMKQQIKKADYFLVFIGKDTHSREWVQWEIKQAKSLNKPIVAIKEKRSYKSPNVLHGSSATWLYSFSEEKIRNALDS